jgi:hypothetical protein
VPYSYDLPHREDTRADLDLASAALAVEHLDHAGARGPGGGRYPDMPWEPKTAFDALADYYRG